MTVTAFIQGKTRRAVTQFSIHATSATNVSSRARSGPDAGGSFKFTDCGIFQKSSGVKKKTQWKSKTAKNSIF